MFPVRETINSILIVPACLLKGVLSSFLLLSVLVCSTNRKVQFIKKNELKMLLLKKHYSYPYTGYKYVYIKCSLLFYVWNKTTQVQNVVMCT